MIGVSREVANVLATILIRESLVQNVFPVMDERTSLNVRAVPMQRPICFVWAVSLD